MTKVWILYLGSEWCEKYFYVFSYKPSDAEILEIQKEVWQREGQDVGDFSTDLLYVIDLMEKVVK